MAAERTQTDSGAMRVCADIADPTDRPRRGDPSSRWAIRVALGIAAAILVLLAWRLPVWEARLSAPQYPAGLSLTAYAHGVEGDIREVNELNHYVGMEAFDEADAPEMKLWAPVLLLAIVAVAIATVLPARGWLARFARLGLWLIPIGALLDVQFRLYQYGQGVKPDAAIRLEPFTPLVVGPTKVLNFTTWAYPGAALWCLFLAAFLLSFAVPLSHRIHERWIHRPIVVYVRDDEEGAAA
ncbi:MAG: hypothetical protein ABI572_08655 [Actinomycetota bacterium]